MNCRAVAQSRYNRCCFLESLVLKSGVKAWGGARVLPHLFGGVSTALVRLDLWLLLLRCARFRYARLGYALSRDALFRDAQSTCDRTERGSYRDNA